MNFGLFVLSVALALVNARPRSADEPLAISRRQAVNGTNSCDQDFPSYSGFIYTPNYPQNYDDDSFCVYTIQPPLNSSYSVEFEACSCDIETDNGGCNWDYIKFGNNKTCGSLHGRQYNSMSSNGKVEVTFKSDGSVTLAGCQIAFSVSVGGQTLSRQNCPVFTSTTPNIIFTQPWWNATTPSWNWTSPPSNWTSPSWNWTSPSANWTSPPTNWTTPSWNWTSPSANWTSPPTNWTTPSWNGSIYELVNEINFRSTLVENAYRDLMGAVNNLIARVTPFM